MWIHGSILFLCCLTVRCEEECEPGKYGDGCNKSCSQNCEPLLNGIVLCHKETGECFEGCKAGVYGDQCDEPCSKHCLGNTCNQHNGHCTWGCIENHIGVFCEIYNGITIVHQGTTSSSHTTVTTGVAPTSSSEVIIPVVVTVLILILVGAVVIIIWRRKKKKTKKKKESALRLEHLQGFLSGSPRDGQDTQDFHLKEPDWMIDIQEIKDMLTPLRKMKPGAPQPSDSSVFSPVMETQIECGRRETLRGSSKDDSATPTPARRYTRAVDDLRDACRKGKLAEVKRILDTDRADVNCRGERSRTPVMAAALGGHRGVVEFLVGRGADVSLVTDGGNNILHYACMGGDRKTVEFVLSRDGVDINSRGWRSWTPVMWAAWRGHRDVVEFLVSRRADVSLVDDGGNNILHWACVGGDRKTVEFVLSRDVVDVNARNNNGKTAVDVARDQGHRQLSDLLVSRGTQ